MGITSVKTKTAKGTASELGREREVLCNHCPVESVNESIVEGLFSGGAGHGRRAF